MINLILMKILLSFVLADVNYWSLNNITVYAKPVISQSDASISGTLYDSFGNLLSGVDVILLNGSQKNVTQSDKQGKYSFNNLVRGDYIVKTFSSNKMMGLNAFSRKNIHLEKNEKLVINLSPLISINDIPIAEANINGKIEIGTNKPTENKQNKLGAIIVQVMNPYSLELIDQAIVSENGSYKLHIPCYGNYLIQVICPGYDLETTTLKVNQSSIERNFIINKRSD